MIPTGCWLSANLACFLFTQKFWVHPHPHLPFSISEKEACLLSSKPHPQLMSWVCGWIHACPSVGSKHTTHYTLSGPQEPLYSVLQARKRVIIWVLASCTSDPPSRFMLGATHRAKPWRRRRKDTWEIHALAGHFCKLSSSSLHSLPALT